MNTPLSQHLAATSLLGLALGLCVTSAALAIPFSQQDVDTLLTDPITSETDVIVPDTQVTVNNNTRRRCIIQFSSEYRIDQPGDGARIHNVLDSTDPSECTVHGPEDVYVASSTELDTRTAIWVRRIPSGTHTIRVCASYRNLNGIPGGEVRLWVRSLTVECETE